MRIAKDDEVEQDASLVIPDEQERVQDVSPRSLRTALSQWWSNVVLPFCITRLILLLIGVVTTYYIVPLINPNQPIHLDQPYTRFPDLLWRMWGHFDSGFYLNIAQAGYWNAASLKGMSNWAFFPLYPALIRLVAWLFGSSDNAFFLAGIVIANAAAIIAGIYLYELITKEIGQTVASRGVFYLMLFPMSFYLSAIYPEALFLALTVSCVYYARLRRWWLAGMLGGLAALTRPQGVVLIAVVGWEYWQFLADRYAPLQPRTGTIAVISAWLHSRLFGFWRSFLSWRTWSRLAALFLIPTGLAIFCIYSKWKVGRFLAFQVVEHNGWGRAFANPLKVLQGVVQHPLPANPYDWNFYALNTTVIILFLLLLIPIFRKLPSIYGIFTLLFVFVPLSTNEPNSIARYYLGIFPVFIILAWWSSRGSQEQQGRRHSLIVVSSTLLLSLGMVMFTLGIYSMA